MNEIESEVQKEPSFPSRVLRVFYSPRKVFESLDRRPEWIWAALLGLVISLALTFILLPRVFLPEHLAALRDNPDITPERLSAVEERFQGMLPTIMGLASALFGFLVGLFGKSLVIFVAALAFLSARAPFTKVLSVMAYSGFIGLLSYALKTPLMVAKGTRNIETSLAVFVSPDEGSKVVRGLLGSFDVFAIWELAIVSIGIGVIFKVTGKKAAMMVVPIWIVWRVLVSFLGSFAGRT
ncbi:MAG: YIP1 family protein [Candidatus Eisenbacteria bacterium]|nr:YIP1 family protein [Candidatus Eisenbacteria bacterium]